MDQYVNPIAAASSVPQAIPQPDLRPVADAAALARDAQPSIPLPVPASTAPVASVNQSRISPVEQPDIAVKEVERTLKPYGVTMLPHGPDGGNSADLPENAPETA